MSASGSELLIRHFWLALTIVAREIINTDFHITDNSANENEWGQMVLRI